MNILVACEYSATVRDAFRALGHSAWSCDLLKLTAGRNSTSKETPSKPSDAADRQTASRGTY